MLGDTTTRAAQQFDAMTNRKALSFFMLFIWVGYTHRSRIITLNKLRSSIHPYLCGKPREKDISWHRNFAKMCVRHHNWIFSGCWAGSSAEPEKNPKKIQLWCVVCILFCQIPIFYQCVCGKMMDHRYYMSCYFRNAYQLKCVVTFTFLKIL